MGDGSKFLWGTKFAFMKFEESHDIVLSANIIDLATQRGAFKAAEAGQVGACFEKLVAFIKANTPETDENKETPAKAESPKE